LGSSSAPDVGEDTSSGAGASGSGLDGRMKILVLDDEEVVCSRLKPALEKGGYQVDTFTDSRLAKQRLERERYDVIVTDLKMANVDGMDIFLSTKERWPDTEVIIITGFATVDITRKALQAGARDVIAKPFKIRELKELIDRIAAEGGRSGDR
jgi:DNA-binding NtrC family response regulator